MYSLARVTGLCHLERSGVPCECYAPENAVNHCKAPPARSATVRSQALMLLVQPDMGQLKKARNVMSSAPQFPLIIPRPRSRLRLLQEADKTEETAFIRSCAALQLLDRVLLTLQETRKNAKAATQTAYQPDDANCSHHRET